MSESLSLAQRLALVKFLTDTLAKVRKDDLLPQSAAEMPPGTRLPVMFGGKLAAWASMPQPSKKSAYVSDERKLLAWAETQYPEHVVTDDAVVVTEEVLAVLREHLPSAIFTARKVDPQWAEDLKGALKGGGHYITATGEKLTEVPGITVPGPTPPVPSVDLAEDAAAIIADAWRAGDIPVADLLALPAGENGATP